MRPAWRTIQKASKEGAGTMGNSRVPFGGIRLHTLEGDDGEFFWSLYESAFPLNERKPREVQLRAMQSPDYFACVFREADQPVGLLGHWVRPEFIYLEHVAIAPSLRSRGIGARILRALLATADRPVLLEADPPETEIATRRIGFYERLDFVQNPHIRHIQPPYRPETGPVPLELLSHPSPISKALHARFQAWLIETLRDHVAEK